MKVLIAGGGKFPVTEIASRFLLDDDQVFIIGKNNIKFDKYLKESIKSYHIDLADIKCKEVFRNRRIDSVIYLGNFQMKNPEAMAANEMNYHMNGLINLVTLSLEYGIKRFVYISSTKVYGDDPDTQGIEIDKLTPQSLWAANHAAAEDYVLKSCSMQPINAAVLRASTVYGPGQNSDNNPISYLISKSGNMLRGEIPWAEKTMIDPLYITDFTEAIFRATHSPVTDILNICSSKKYSLLNLEGYLAKLKNDPDYTYDIPFQQSHSIDRAANALDFVPSHSLTQGIPAIIESNEKSGRIGSSRSEKNKPSDGFIRRLFIRENEPMFLLVLLENLILFALVVYLVLFRNYTMLFGWIDIRLVYILIISSVYGLKQSTISTILSIGLLLYQFSLRNDNMLLVVFDTATMVAIFMCFFTGIILGYIVDYRTNVISEMKDQVKNIDSQLIHLKSMYVESLKVKDSLQDQILGVDNSFGKVFDVVSGLDSLSSEFLTGSIIKVVENIMQSDSVSLYMTGENSRYLRMAARSEKMIELPKSLSVDTITELLPVVEEGHFFISRQVMGTHGIIMASPILSGETVIAVLMIHEASVDYLTLSHENLFRITSNLISQSIVRAREYEDVIFSERYIENTFIMKNEYFTKILMEKTQNKNAGTSNFVLLQVIEPTKISEVSEKASSLIREMDYLGSGINNDYYIILSNTDEDESGYVMGRLSAIGVDTNVIKEVAV